MFDVDCVASASTYTRLMGKKPPDPLGELDDEGEDELEDFGDLDDEEEVPTTNLEPDNVKEDKVTNHKPRTNDIIDENWWGEGDLNKIVQKDMNYLLNKKSPWSQVCSYPDDDYVGPVSNAQFGTKDHAAHPTPTKTKTVDKPKKDDEVTQCKMCQVSDQPPAVYLSHHTFDPACPSMTEQERRQLYGSLGGKGRQGHRR